MTLGGTPSTKVLRRLAAVVAAGCLAGALATGCDGGSGSDSGSGSGDGSAASPTAASMPGQAPDPTTRCGTTVKGEKVVLTAGDGVRLAAARFGSGGHGVVLLPQSGSDLCGWAGFIPDLVQRGLQVLAVDPRCAGYSDCPADDSGEELGGERDYAADAGAAIADLHANGATKVAVMGASLGAATAFVAAGRYPDQVSAVVSLSLFDAGFSASQTDVRTATDAAPHVTAPILICLSTADSGTIPENTARALVAAAPSRAGSSVVVRDGAEHGWAMLVDDALKATVLDFLARHT